jgi:hypothetical protein
LIESQFGAKGQFQKLNTPENLSILEYNLKKSWQTNNNPKFDIWLF